MRRGHGRKKKEHTIKTEMSAISERIIEVEVTTEDIEKMRADGVSEADLPEAGIKHFRPARHILKDKVAILLDIDIVQHFKERVKSDDTEFYQKQINQTLRRAIEHEK